MYSRRRAAAFPSISVPWCRARSIAQRSKAAGNLIERLGKPVICALNGSAAGYGLDLALGADIRVMAQSAKLAASYAKRGVLPESGGTWYLPRMLGWAKAAELIFTGRTLSAAPTQSGSGRLVVHAHACASA